MGFAGLGLLDGGETSKVVVVKGDILGGGC